MLPDGWTVIHADLRAVVCARVCRRSYPPDHQADLFVCFSDYSKNTGKIQQKYRKNRLNIKRQASMIIWIFSGINIYSDTLVSTFLITLTVAAAHEGSR